MKKLVIILISSLLLGGCTIKNPMQKKPAGLDINTSPSAVVYLNGEQVGNTPYSQTDLEPGDYQVKLVPLESLSLPSWETQISLKPEVTTIINKSFAPSEADSASYILELRPEPGDVAYLSVISDPDTVNLDIDGKSSGYTPAVKLTSTPGAHQLNLTSPGYKSLELSVNAVKGYNLLVNAKLASDIILLSSPPPATTSAIATPTETENEGEYVVIQETGTGWLRIRKEPSSSAEELGKANVGEKLPYLGETSETGWYQVEFEGQTGWLSAKYATLVK